MARGFRVDALNIRTRETIELARALKNCRQHFIYAAVFSAAMNMLFLGPTLYMLQVYDRIIPSRSGNTLAILTIAVMLVLAAQAALDGFRSRLLVRASVRLDNELSSPLFAQALRRLGSAPDAVANQPMRYFDTLRQALTGPAMIALCDLPWTPLYLAFCFLLHPWLGALALVGILAVSAVALWNERRTRRSLQIVQEAAQGAYTMQEQILGRADVVNALGMLQPLTARHARARQVMIAAQANTSFTGGALQSLSKFLRLSLQSLALGAGAALAIDNRISAGAIFAASFLVSRALAPIDLMISHWQSFVQARFAFRELENLMHDVSCATIKTKLPEPLGQIEAEGLGLMRGERRALESISFLLQPGEAMAVIGPSGSGKSTLLRLLAGAEQLGAGSIRFDGAEQQDWDSQELAKHIGYLAQDVGLIAGTIKENICRFASEFASREGGGVDKQTLEAARHSGAHELILRLPGGYDHMLGPNGSGVSAGQAQRIGLARALYGNPRILILDEPNAQLDAAGETALFRALAGVKAKHRSMIFSTHRTALLRLADKVLVLRDGQVEHFGERKDVLRRLQPSISGSNLKRQSGHA